MKIVSKVIQLKKENIILLFVVLFAVLLSLKYYPGVENSQYYSGLSLQTIHPELFTKDPAEGQVRSITGSPLKASAYYLLPKLFGEIWLDDRFTIFFYIVVVAASFLATDRIAVTLGAKGLLERLTILMFFLKDHQVLRNKIIFAQDPDFNHSAFAVPISLWLLYIALSRKRVFPVILMIILLAAVTLPVAPFVAAMGLLIVAVMGSKRESKIAIVLLISGFIVAYFVLFHVINIADNDRIFMWNFLVNHWYRSMVNPFYIGGPNSAFVIVGNAFFLVIFFSALLWPTELTSAMKATKVVLAVGLAAWLLAGLYVTFATDYFKYPQILAFPVARQLQSIQVLAHISLMVVLFRWVYDRPETKRIFTAGVIFLLTFLAGPGNYLMWAGLISLSIAVSYAFNYLLSRRQNISPLVLVKPILAHGLGLTMSVAMMYGIWQHIPNWEMAIKTGIYGSSGAAKWINVAKYFRKETPIDTVILPMEYGLVSVGGTSKLTIRRDLASRSGRAIAIPVQTSHGLNPERFRWILIQRNIAMQIAENWMQGNAKAVINGIDELEPSPDYIVVPSAESHRMDGTDFPFVLEKKIDNFSIFYRR